MKIEPREWDAQTARRIEWVKGLTLTEPFDLLPQLRVVDPRQFHRALLADIARGPDGPRARTGSLQFHLERLEQLFGTEKRA